MAVELATTSLKMARTCGRSARSAFLSSIPISLARRPSIHNSGCMSTIVDDPTALIAGRIRQERERRGWPLAELAERSGVSRAMISKVERCEASPTATILVRLASAFDLTLGGLRSEEHTSELQ